MNFHRTSRRDDMISLTYLLIFLLNSFEFPLFPEEFYTYNEANVDMFQYLQKMKAYKQKVNLKEMLRCMQYMFPRKKDQTSNEKRN